MFSLGHYAVNIVYQPKFNLLTNSLDGFEVLSRFTDSRYASVAPQLAIERLNEEGLLDHFTLLLLETATRQLQYYGFSNNSVSVNILQTQLNSWSFLSNLVALTKQYPGIVSVELSELDTNNSVMKPSAISYLQENSVQVSLDDFGKENSTVNEVLGNNYCEVKLDKSIVDLLSHSKTQSFINSLVHFFKSVGIKFVIEGVECIECLKTLRTLGVSYVQGFVLSQPVEIQKLDSVINSGLKVLKSNN